MKRRNALKQLALVASAAVILPGCIADPKKVSVALTNLDITGDEEALLAEIAETIIPATEKPGAKAVGAHLFTLVMVDDCVDTLSREKYLKGLRSFDEYCNKVGGRTFLKSSSEERLNLLTKIEQGIDVLSEEVKIFYSTSKKWILQGYLSSQYFLTEVKPYQLVPGPHYNGCAPVSKTPNII